MNSGRGAAGGGLSREDCKCRAGQRRQEWGWVSQEEPVMEKHSRCVYSRAGIYSRFNNLFKKQIQYHHAQNDWGSGRHNTQKEITTVWLEERAIPSPKPRELV